MLFGDQVLATAILDRLLHPNHLLRMPGDSYRLIEPRLGVAATPMAGTAQQAPKPLSRWVYWLASTSAGNAPQVLLEQQGQTSRYNRCSISSVVIGGSPIT